MLSKKLFVRFIDGGETNEPNTDEEIYGFIDYLLKLICLLK